ncbi:MAG TPA: hypothetical protein EYQ12_05620, partial [Oceanospirillaceae bacterium]|nr:hypothetical protein [Oceanospirillaceae bacterium]
MSLLRVLLTKELRDALRDRRSVMATLMYSLLTPLLMAIIFALMAEKYSDPEILYVHMDKAEEAQPLVQHLASQHIQQAKAGTPTSKNDITIEFETGFSHRISRGETAAITIYANFSVEEVYAQARRLRKQINAYGQQLTQIRLIARGVSPSIIQPITIVTQDQDSPEAKNGVILGFFIYLLLYAVFMSGMSLAIDTSAGERERNPLVSLLSVAVNRTQIVLAKVLVVAIFSMAGLAASALIFVAFMAKSFKKAQAYLAYVIMARLTTYNSAP